ncbi:UNVERIFIED_CONTAM: hypothetical protein GTU68_013286 [Idotea baltica]|nr:hypothetical protein [Idotea baltica]
MIYPKIPLAQTVIQLCKAKHIKHIIISPGSRNAPLTIGFSNDDYFRCYSIVDERCAAFFAMGIAQKTKNPTAVVCTSGSALLNYYPAVAEAFYSDIPLLVLSADRPKHLIGIGDGQTINQKNVFENHILYSTNLKLDLDLENKLETLLGLKKSIQDFNAEEINKAINISVTQNGPVHINIPFNEPLYETVDVLNINPTVIKPQKVSLNIEKHLIDQCISTWSFSKRKLVLIGVNQINTINKSYLEALAEDDSIIVFTETTSNINNDAFFPSIDKIIAPLSTSDFEKLQPEIVLTFGGLIVSKKIKAFLRTYKPKHHWHVDLKKANDTFFSLNLFLKTSPDYFLSKLLSAAKHVKSDYRPYWNTIKTNRNDKHQTYLDGVAHSDLKAFHYILKAIPNNTVLQLGNSSTVRYAQLFDLNKTLEVYCNRGTSGIDGSTSTAIGFAVASHKQTTLITGDISFFYDSNALWNNYIPKNFRIILINNSGGGIFRILPGDKNTEAFTTFFETKHELTAEHLCNMYGFKYGHVDNETNLESTLKEFYNNDESPKLLEVFTPRTLNDEILINYFKFLR